MEDRYLYRAKRKSDKKWSYGNLIQTDDGVYIIQNYVPKHLIGKYEVDPSTICQYTCLKDKNGKLIWEKDIVDGHIKRGAAFLNCLVLWNESKARFDVRAKGCNFPMTLDEVAGDISVGGLDYEIVGNQFDNPELLEVQA